MMSALGGVKCSSGRACHVPLYVCAYTQLVHAVYIGPLLGSKTTHGRSVFLDWWANHTGPRQAGFEVPMPLDPVTGLREFRSTSFWPLDGAHARLCCLLLEAYALRPAELAWQSSRHRVNDTIDKMRMQANDTTREHINLQPPERSQSNFISRHAKIAASLSDVAITSTELLKASSPPPRRHPPAYRRLARPCSSACGQRSNDNDAIHVPAGQLLGNTPYSQGGDETHNCQWTLQARIYAQYQSKQAISVTGNDDIWMFINGEVRATERC